MAPVTNGDGVVVGLVGAGVSLRTVGQSLQDQIPVIMASAGVALLLAVGSAALVSRRLRRQTRGIGPSEMTRMYEHHDAVLHAVREGVLITSRDGRLVLANDEARRLLRLPKDSDGQHITELGLDSATVELLCSDRPVTDQVHLAGAGWWPSTPGAPPRPADPPATWRPSGTARSCEHWPARRRWP